LPCRNCGRPVDPRRVELGYDYCLKEECQQQCLRRVELAAVGVNKAADYYMKAEEVVPPRPPLALSAGVDSSTETGPDDLGPDDLGSDDLGAPVRKPAQPKRATSRPKTALDRLREHGHDLDDALGRSYERFRRGEITAAEMHRERDELVGTFNRKVMAENIRYRSLLRRATNGSR
jgi:hypothetical protein